MLALQNVNFPPAWGLSSGAGPLPYKTFETAKIAMDNALASAFKNQASINKAALDPERAKPIRETIEQLRRRCLSQEEVANPDEWVQAISEKLHTQIVRAECVFRAYQDMQNGIRYQGADFGDYIRTNPLAYPQQVEDLVSKDIEEFNNYRPPLQGYHALVIISVALECIDIFRNKLNEVLPLINDA